jgi:hypothetical protein
MHFPILGPLNQLVLFGLGSPPNLPVNSAYKAILSFSDITQVIGTSITLDGRASDANGNPPKYFYWQFESVPIGSQVPRFGFEKLENDDSRIRFTPDVIGFYRIKLIIGDDFFLSEPIYADIYMKILLVPHGQSIVPNVDFIWDYLGSFWTIFTEKEIFSTLWSAYTQIFSNYLLELYQVDRNKSVITIQDFFQKRWQHYDAEVPLDTDQSYMVLGEDYAGSQAQSAKNFPDQVGGYVDQITIPISEGKFSVTPYGKKIGKRVIRYSESNHVLSRGDEGASPIFPFPIFSLLATEKKEVIQLTTNQYWRLSTTFKHLTIDFEKEGIKFGDYIKLRVNLLKNGISQNSGSVIYLPLTGSSGNSVGVVWDENLTDGVSCDSLSKERILKLASDLGIEGISTDVSGNIIYLPNTLGAYLKTSLNSTFFKRKYYEEDLNFSTSFDFGFFQSNHITFTVEPLSIVRNKAILLDEDVTSIPTLQEYIEQPALTDIDGKKYVVKNGAQSKVLPIYKDPIFFYENLDYIIGQKEFNVYANFTAGSNLVTLPLADLIDRSVEQGDLLAITGINGEEGGKAKNVIITEILDKSTLRLQLDMPFTVKDVKCKIIRRQQDNYLRYVNNVFKQNDETLRKENFQSTIGIRLWGDVTYFDNGKYVEDNFGTIVQITREKVKTQKISAPYRSAVSGLLYALVKGPSMYNMKIGAQILLGLPFAYYKGRISEITPNYSRRLDTSPEYGRISIKELDQDNKETGLTSNYFYPRGAQKNGPNWEPVNPDFSGIAINPVTNKEYVVGDVVEQFAPLSKGVEIVDYLSNPDFVKKVLNSPEGQLLKFHTFFLRANTDLFSGPDLSFVSQYLKTVKPVYLFSRTVSERTFSDEVLITDALRMIVRENLFDTPYLSLPSAVKFDYYNDSPTIYTIDGKIYCRYIKGKDLTLNGNTAISNSGGFINPRVNEYHDTPYILPGDYLVIYNGVNQGTYTVNSVISDTTIDVPGTPFSIENELTFAIYREIKNPIWNSSASITQGNNVFTVSTGLLSAGVAVGDLIFFYQTTRTKIYRIIDLTTTTITLDRNFEEMTSFYDFVIYRSGLLTKYLLSDDSYIFTGTLTNGNPWINVALSPEKSIIKKGDTLYNDKYSPFEILDYDETFPGVYVTPTPTVTDAVQAKIFRNSAPEGFPSDITLIDLQDVPSIDIVPNTSTSTTVAGSDIVTFSLGTDLSVWKTMPGDFFIVTAGPDSLVDIGYGLGVYVIAEVQTIAQIKLTRPLSANINILNYKIRRTVSSCN